MKKIAAVAGLIVVLGGAMGVLVKYRFWPWIWEFRALAEQSTTTSINQQYDLLLILQSRISLCESQKKTPDECKDLKLQEWEKQQKIEDLKVQQKEWTND